MKASPPEPSETARAQTADLPFPLRVAGVRHDLNNSITHIVGFGEILLEEVQELGHEPLRADLEFINRTAGEMMKRVNEGLNSQRIEAGLAGLAQLQERLCDASSQIGAAVDRLTRGAHGLGQVFQSDLSRMTGAARRVSELACTTLAPLSPPTAAPGFQTGTTVNPLAALPRPALEMPRALPAQKEGAILVVDDLEENRELLSRRLSRLGYSVQLMDDGARALEFVSANPVDVILLDIMMPGMDGFEVLQRLKNDAATQHIPVLMLSSADEIDNVVRCIQMGADDFLPKPFNPTLLMARLGSSLSRKRLRDQERRTYEALLKTQQQLAAELSEAAAYLRSLLPAPLTGALETEWCFHPSQQLGGDAFGYHWLDDRHFALYLLDVCGHGVGAALLSVSVLNTLRAQALPSVDFRRPAQVLAGLNRAYRMENHNQLYFTIWYGIYRLQARELVYASGGHPPALLLGGADPQKQTPIALKTASPAIGCLEEAAFVEAVQPVESGARLLVLSDGVFEILRPNNQTDTWNDFVAGFTSPEIAALRPAERLRRAQQLRGGELLEDDFSLVEVRFPRVAQPGTARIGSSSASGLPASG